MKLRSKASVPIFTIAIIIIVVIAMLGIYWFISGDGEADCSDVVIDYSPGATGQTWFDPEAARFVRNWFDIEEWQYETPDNAYTYSTSGKTNKEVFNIFRDKVLHYKPVSQGFTNADLDWFYCACKQIIKEL
jgi:hypothetical protein